MLTCTFLFLFSFCFFNLCCFRQVFTPKDCKKIVRHYNHLAKTLVKFETLYFQAWCKMAEGAKAGLQCVLIIKDSKQQMVVNFDTSVLLLMKEAKNLRLMDFQIPESAKVVLLLEDKLKKFYNQLTHALNRYNNVVKVC